MIENYETLANAIIEQAVKDYKKILKYIYRHPRCHKNTTEAVALENFFHSEWFRFLTDMDGDRLMVGVQALVRKEVVL